MKPIILIPMGDPAGIGPEIAAKALAREETVQRARCVVVGDRQVMEQAVRIVDLPLTIHTINEPEEGRFDEADRSGQRGYGTVQAGGDQRNVRPGRL